MSKKDEALKLALETSEGIVNADWRKWDELASPSEFERWAKSRANFMATILREALAEQPAHPVVPDAIHHTDLSESLEYIKGWNDCRAAMFEGKENT